MSENLHLDKIVIKAFNPHSCSPERWDLFHEYRRAIHYQQSPDILLEITNEQAETSYLLFSEHPDFEIYLYSIEDIDANKQIGEIRCILPLENTEMYKKNSQYMEFYITLLQNYRKKGIGTIALKTISDVAQKKGKTLLATDTYNQDGKAFLQAIGANLAIGKEIRLNLEDVNWNLVDKWITEGKKRSPTTKLVCLNSIPEELIDQFRKLYTETYNQQPWEVLDEVAFIFSVNYFKHLEKSMHETGGTWIIIVTMENNGEISGLTELRYNPAFKNVIKQELTGVKEKYRGKGLGKWLKASMLLELRKQLPEVKIIRSENVINNAPMISINDKLGFKFYSECIEAHITIDKLEEYLASKEEK